MFGEYVRFASGYCQVIMQRDFLSVCLLTNKIASTLNLFKNVHSIVKKIS